MDMTPKVLPFAVALVVAVAGLPAVAADMAAKTMQTGMGPVLADPHGMTLYTNDHDSATMSSCAGPCAQNWPPLMAPAGAMAHGDWTVVSREGGGMQWAYKGHPLYTWSKDAKPGDTTGEGFKGMWHVAKP
jgi:predicted lipoprotein with Yx(FWY)xxD motif